jgi:hypothetical protein
LIHFVKMDFDSYLIFIIPNFIRYVQLQPQKNTTIKFLLSIKNWAHTPTEEAGPNRLSELRNWNDKGGHRAVVIALRLREECITTVPCIEK